MTTLANAIINKQRDVVRDYILRGGPVNEIDEYGFTPLIESAITNDFEMAKILLDGGADVLMPDLVGGTALHWAVENENMPLARLLLEKGADPNAANFNGEPVYVKPLLRNQPDLKLLLNQYGARIDFATDFINAKLIGHRYDLRGSCDIISPHGHFVEVGFEGFFLEFSLGLVRFSLEQYAKNYNARSMRKRFDVLHSCIKALRSAEQLIFYQHYQQDVAAHRTVIDALMQEELLILPCNFEGHAIVFIVYEHWLIRCDRRKIDQALNGICVFSMRHPGNLTPSLMRRIIFEKKTKSFVDEYLTDYLGLRLAVRLVISPQVSGNCSWANVVSVLPAVDYLLTELVGKKKPPILGEPLLVDHMHHSIQLYQHWRDWDRLRMLDYFVQAFEFRDKKRRASIVSLLAAVIFQRFSAKDPQVVEVARPIIKILQHPDYHYVLDAYLNQYYRQSRTPAGENLFALIHESDSFI